MAKTGEVMKARPVRMTDAEWEKCKRLGGAKWVRDRIDRAKEPNAIGQGSAACGASPAPTGCASSGNYKERTSK